MRVSFIFFVLCCLLLAVTASTPRQSAKKKKSVSHHKMKPASVLDVGRDFRQGMPCPNRKHRRDRFNNCYDPNDSVIWA